MLQAPEQIPLQPVVQAMMRQIHPAVRGGPHTGTIGHTLEEAAAHGAGSQQELQL